MGCLPGQPPTVLTLQGPPISPNGGVGWLTSHGPSPGHPAPQKAPIRRPAGQSPRVLPPYASMAAKLSDTTCSWDLFVHWASSSIIKRNAKLKKTAISKIAFVHAEKSSSILDVICKFSENQLKFVKFAK